MREKLGDKLSGRENAYEIWQAVHCFYDLLQLAGVLLLMEVFSNDHQLPGGYIRETCTQRSELPEEFQ